MTHTPVLLKEVIDILDIKEGDIYLDATLGGAGHAEEVVKRMGDKVVVAGIDADPAVIEGREGKFGVLNFRNIKEAPEKLGIKNPNKILFDLGWNKMQFEGGNRGFSFQKDEPLLMTFGPDTKFTAYDVVNTWDKENISTILEAYGEEKFAYRIANKIIEEREIKPIKTSFDLVEIINQAVPTWYKHKRIHPATKTFQALRIAVNDELQTLQQGLEGGFEILESGGRVAVITFHSLEDRIVKRFFRKLADDERGNLINKKPITASREEIKENPRSRSAKLRAIQKI